MDQQYITSIINTTFNENFDLKKFIKFVNELFGNFIRNEKIHNIPNEYADFIHSNTVLGTYTDIDKKSIDILVVKLKRASSRDQARSKQRDLIGKYLKNSYSDAALVVFYGDDPEDWRLSFMKIDYNLTINESDKVIPVERLTPTKRYSFLVGKNEPNHTCMQQFLKIFAGDDELKISDLENVFSIDNVTKEFFSNYKDLFLELKKSLEIIIENDNNVKNEFEEKNISTIDFSKKLLGQIVFIYFLQKKGWMGVNRDSKSHFNHWNTGPKDFLRKLFNKNIINYNNFFKDILEPLFYEALSNERDSDYYSKFNCKIPFLNGGLFEPINDYDWTQTDIVLSNSIFKKILDTFDRFNFTVKEDEPLEKEIAVDPEMLGKVFEKLLDIKDRRSKGAYYTPREIVHYMCQQSIINYLVVKTNIQRIDIDKLVKMGLIAPSIKKNIDNIETALKNIKIVDPACGSGAFLIGMLNEIVKIRFLLSPNITQNIYNLKREIIKNCLYGVDSDISAVDISKLRFWLSLIVDEMNIKNIKPLPNLDHKIMCGNSLMEEFEGIKLFDGELLLSINKTDPNMTSNIDEQLMILYEEKRNTILGKSNVKSTKNILKEIKKLKNMKRKLQSKPSKNESVSSLDDHINGNILTSRKKLSNLKILYANFFNEQDKTLKKHLHGNIDKIEWELIESTLKEQNNYAALNKLLQYKKNNIKPFFLWKLYFVDIFDNDNPGFDVVIGNPPYGFRNVLSTSEKKYYRKIKKLPFPSGDIAELFIINSLKSLVNNSGCLTFIIPKKSLYGESWFGVRQIWNSYRLTFLMDASKAFDDVLLEQVSFSIIKEKPHDNSIEVSYLQQNSNKLHIMDKCKLSEIITDDQKNIQLYKNTCPKQLLKKISLATDNQMGYIRSKIGISGITSDLTFDDEQYPCVKGFDICKYGIKKRKRFLKSDVAKKYIKLYDHDKIIGQEIIAYIEHPSPHIMITLFYDSNNILLNDTCVELKSDNDKLDKKFLLGYLHSTFCNWYCYNFIYNRAIRTMHFINYYVSQIVVPKNFLIKKNQKPIIDLVDQIIILSDNKCLNESIKKNEIKKIEKKIDHIIYKQYDFNDDEIKFIES